MKRVAERRRGGGISPPYHQGRQGVLTVFHARLAFPLLGAPRSVLVGGLHAGSAAQCAVHVPGTLFGRNRWVRASGCLKVIKGVKEERRVCA